MSIIDASFDASFDAGSDRLVESTSRLTGSHWDLGGKSLTNLETAKIATGLFTDYADHAGMSEIRNFLERISEPAQEDHSQITRCYSGEAAINLTRIPLKEPDFRQSVAQVDAQDAQAAQIIQDEIDEILDDLPCQSYFVPEHYTSIRHIEFKTAVVSETLQRYVELCDAFEKDAAVAHQNLAIMGPNIGDYEKHAAIDFNLADKRKDCENDCVSQIQAGEIDYILRQFQEEQNSSAEIGLHLIMAPSDEMEDYVHDLFMQMNVPLIITFMSLHDMHDMLMNFDDDCDHISSEDGVVRSIGDKLQDLKDVQDRLNRAF